MSTIKKLKTYSKINKVVDYSTLFTNIIDNNDLNNSPKSTASNNSSIISEKNAQVKQKSRESAAKMSSGLNNDAPKKKITKTKATNNIKNNKEDAPTNKESQFITKTSRVKRKQDKENVELGLTSLANVTPIQSSTKLEFSATDQEKKTLTRNKNSKSEQVKLFETTNSIDMSIKNRHSTRIENDCSTRRRSSRNNTHDTNNVSNNLLNRSASPSATAIVSSAIDSCIDEYDFQNEVKKQQAKHTNDAKTKLKSNENLNSSDQMVKSIIKKSKPAVSEQNNQEKCIVVSKPKRIVRILEEINLKNDQLAQVKLDNKTKHSASTSTPSGLRRRPLKLPQDVSLISKN